jgi:hypothetical protein
MVLLGLAVEPFPMPVVPEVPVPVVPPVVDGLALMPVPELPAADPAPELPPLCAKANVLDSANAVARAIVVSFIGCFLSAQREPKQLATDA